MALVTTDPGSSVRRAPWRGVVVGVFAALLFIVGVAFVARATRDGAGGVPREIVVVVDAGTAVDAGFADAGWLMVDAGAPDAIIDAGEIVEVIGAESEPDAGPIDVAGPPIIAADVVAVTVPLVEDCLKKALRFDPSLGGRVKVRIVVTEGRLAPTLPGSSSPVLSSCVASGGALLAWPTAAGEKHVVEARVHLDGLRKTVRVEAVELMQPE